MLRKSMVVVVTLLFVLAVAFPAVAAPRQQTSSETLLWSFVERFLPQFTTAPQKSDSGPGIDPDGEDKGSSMDPGGSLWPPSGTGSQTTQQSPDPERGPGSDPNGQS